MPGPYFTYYRVRRISAYWDVSADVKRPGTQTRVEYLRISRKDGALYWTENADHSSRLRLAEAALFVRQFEYEQDSRPAQFHSPTNPHFRYETFGAD